ncbi:MAG: NUDIX domain-containing protein [Candidatus Paceibacterota bacterium]|jgi:8-oxo-dGDP phosphatase
MGDIVKIFIVAGVVIEKNGKFLLVQERKQDCYGRWNLPAGKVEEGFSIEETAVKETKEETGLDVELLEEIAIFHESSERPVQHAFKAKIIGGELNFRKEELLDAKWFSIEELGFMKDKLRGDWVLASIKKSLS